MSGQLFLLFKPIESVFKNRVFNNIKLVQIIKNKKVIYKLQNPFLNFIPYYSLYTHNKRILHVLCYDELYAI